MGQAKAPGSWHSTGAVGSEASSPSVAHEHPAQVRKDGALFPAELDEAREALGVAISLTCALEAQSRLAVLTGDADLVRQVRATHGAAVRACLRLKAALRARRVGKAAA